MSGRQPKKAQSLLAQANLAFWDAVFPRAFWWYKDKYMRGGQYRIFRYPSAASEPTDREETGVDHYRTPYQYSRHNVRRLFAKNEDLDNRAELFLTGNVPLPQKLIEHGLLAAEDAGNNDKVNKAADKFQELFGSDPRVSFVYSSYDKPLPELNAVLNPNATAEEKREQLRGLFETNILRESQANAANPNQVLDSIYHPYQMYNTQDHMESLPEWRQNRIDAIMSFEELVVGPRQKEGKMKVFKGNPRKHWQVLDESFSSDARLSAQAAIKDSRSVAIGLPSESQGAVSRSQAKRSGLVIEEDHVGEEEYVSLPLVSKHVK